MSFPVEHIRGRRPRAPTPTRTTRRGARTRAARPERTGPLKPCATPGCPNLTRTTRCQGCEQGHQKARNAKRTHYHGSYTTRARHTRDTAVRCWICNKAFTPGDRIHADHVRPGDPTSPLKPAHARCNTSRGNRPPDTVDPTDPTDRARPTRPDPRGGPM